MDEINDTEGRTATMIPKKDSSQSQAENIGDENIPARFHHCAYIRAQVRAANLQEIPRSLSPSNKLENVQKNIPKKNCLQSKKGSAFLNSVNQAVKKQKVFVIGNRRTLSTSTVRKELMARGWIEKSCVADLIVEDGVDSKVSELSARLLSENPPNFFWAVSFVDFNTIHENTIVSRFPKKVHFTTKIGLCRCLESQHWFYQPGVAKTVAPRTFTIENENDIDNFMDNFGLTACISLLKIITEQFITAESDHFFRNGKVPISVVDFANAQCSEYILCRHHNDIDRQKQPETTAKEWEEFLVWFYMIAHEDEHFQTTPYPMVQALYQTSKSTLAKLARLWEQQELEGCQNLWIVKPAAQFCGKGVRVMRNLDELVKHLKTALEDKNTHVAQKYIEKPLLIYDTKFDIRQWFLITRVYPLVIWIYSECYLKFSSQPFSLENLNRSIHLTNNAVQRHYTNSTARHPKLPQENMWHCATFQEYLRSIEEPNKWEQVILPGIKQGIVGAVLAAQEEMIDRPNTFELYGADFLLGADYVPILLEINMDPAMEASTSVTAQLCRQCIEDIIKVVLDKKESSGADTGNFVLLYKQEMGPKHFHIPHLGSELSVCGSKIITEKNFKINK